MQVWVLRYGLIDDIDFAECEVFTTRELAVACLRRYIDECLDHSDSRYPEELLTDADRERHARDAATRKQVAALDDDAFLNRVFGWTPEGERDPNPGLSNVLDLELQLFDVEVQCLPAETKAA
jgi:hypothetical protein